jgi:hypothetical protein
VTAYCRSCRSEIRVVELRSPAANLARYWTKDRSFPTVPLGTVSFCPVHGLGYTI